jgi:tRNA(fMet)-specific endonuclease VapC
MWTWRSPVSGVVVDTSVWIDFFAGAPTTSLDDALKNNSVVLSPLVVAELISGARRSRDRAAILHLAEKLPVHETPLDHWIRAGELRRQLRSKGVSVSTPDAHVAQCALDRDAILLSRDAVFGRIARHCSLRVIFD